MHPSLVNSPADYIGGHWLPIPGASLVAVNPARPASVVWSGSPNPAHTNLAVAAARTAQPAWESVGLEQRVKILRRFAALATARVDQLTNLLRDEVGKPTWDSKAEAQLLANKVEITIDESLRRVAQFELNLGPTKSGRCWFRPHGVLAVLGPFNFPAHLPNGHIVPALITGNTIVFKPSDKTPATGQFLTELYHEALDQENAPPGVINLVQGGALPAASLASHPDIDGVLFTGSWAVGRRIMQANLNSPGRILALEMGGNNPALIMDDADLKQAIIECVRCAFITCGQRCTATRRLIIHNSVADRVINAIKAATQALTVGDPADPTTFMGPLISREARDAVLASFQALVAAGENVILPMAAVRIPADGESGHYITPGILRVQRFTRAPAEPGILGTEETEVFGPLLRISTCTSLDDGIDQANATSFGLAASIFTASAAAAATFQSRVRAGCINWNTGTAGASSKLPFGGLGLSGNHRPAGAFSIDYCAYPVASMIERSNAATTAPGMPEIII